MNISVDQYRDNITEHQLQALVLDHLAKKGKPGIIAMAIPNAGKRSARWGTHMKDEGLTPGAPDLVILLPDEKCALLELKSKRGTQTPEQKGFHARCDRLGQRYGVAKTFEQAIAFLAECGALR